MCAGDFEVLFAALGRGAVERTLLEATLDDRPGNVRTTTVGAHQHPQARLAGSGGGPEPASRGSRLVWSAAPRPSATTRRRSTTSPGPASCTVAGIAADSATPRGAVPNCS